MSFLAFQNRKWPASGGGGGGSIVHIGSAYMSTGNTNITMDSGTATTGTAIPATLSAGKYAIFVGVQSAAPTTATVGGVSLGTAVATIIDNPESVVYYEVTLASTTTASFVFTFATAQQPGIAIYKIDNLTRTGYLAYNRQVGTTAFPFGTDGTNNLTTLANDKVIATFVTTGSTATSYVNLTETVPVATIGGPRKFGSAYTNTAPAGTPATFSTTLNAAFQWTGVIIVGYR